ncbi:cytosine-specific methyltransferase [Chondrocystis sp. NIES-4102]|nr:cytosine-specific methyltransferase [Chondrocystis sp. NIES-4102]
MVKQIRFIDLFCGIGGLRLGFEDACRDLKINSICVFSSEIKSAAIKVYQKNFNGDQVDGDITKIDSQQIPSFDILLAGFPCQSFSSAGNRNGLSDERGVLFYEIERILRDKKPQGFLLENVANLIKHENGKTWKIIEDKLLNLGYKVNYTVLNSKDHGLPQSRERIYIVGTLQQKVNLENFSEETSCLEDILEQGKKTLDTIFVRKLLKKYSLTELYGKAIKDKRGGDNNIHSWDLELKGQINQEQKELLNELLKARRNNKWAEIKGIKWMDGMPLTIEEITSFYKPIFFANNLQYLKDLLDDLVEKKYLSFEHPKDEVEVINKLGKLVKKRLPREDLPKGYNIVTGKLSFEINKILDPQAIAPTLVATDMERIGVIDGQGIRKLTTREGLRMFGFPESFVLDLSVKQAFDLLGNTVPIPVVKKVATRLLNCLNEAQSDFAFNCNYSLSADAESIDSFSPVCSK